jgi:hypothetical protein
MNQNTLPDQNIFRHNFHLSTLIQQRESWFDRLLLQRACVVVKRYSCCFLLINRKTDEGHNTNLFFEPFQRHQNGKSVSRPLGGLERIAEPDGALVDNEKRKVGMTYIRSSTILCTIPCTIYYPRIVVDRASVCFGGSFQTGLPNRTQPTFHKTKPVWSFLSY